MQQTKALLIRKYHFSETSSVIIWLTQEHGKIKTVARSARKQGGAFTGRLDLFSEADIGFTLSSKSDLHPLQEVVPSLQWQSLPSSYLTLLCASYFSELCDLLIEPLYPSPDVFELLRRAFLFLQQQAPTLRAVEYFEKELSKYLGVYRPGSIGLEALHTLLPRLPLSRETLKKEFQARSSY